MIAIPYPAVKLDEALFILKEQGGYFDARGFVMLTEEN